MKRSFYSSRRSMELRVIKSYDIIDPKYPYALCDDDLVYLTSVLQESKVLEELDLSPRVIFYLFGPKCKITLDNGEFTDALAKNKTLRVLNLSNNEIGIEGSKRLAEALKQNNSLEELNLSYNRINDEGAKLLARMLIHNTSLHTINLIGNKISYKGWQCLLDHGRLSTKNKITRLEADLSSSRDYNWMKQAIASKNEVVALREDEIVQLRADLHGKDEVVRGKDKVIAERDMELAAKDVNIKAGEDEIARLKEELASKEEEMEIAALKVAEPAKKRPRTDQDHLISLEFDLKSSKDYNWMKQAIASKNEVVALREDEIVQLRADLHGKDELVRGKDKAIEERDMELAAKDVNIKAGEDEIARLKEELASKEEEMEIAALKVAEPAKKRPRTDQDQSQPKVMSVQLDEDHIKCFICKNKYSTDMTNNKKRLPVLSSSKSCDHYFCHGCILDTQAALTENNAPKWIPCMRCRTKTAFCPSEPKYHRMLIGLLEQAKWTEVPAVTVKEEPSN